MEQQQQRQLKLFPLNEPTSLTGSKRLTPKHSKMNRQKSRSELLRKPGFITS